MTVIECICAKCGKPFIWVVVVGVDGSVDVAYEKYVECPFCKSHEVSLWHPEIKWSSGRQKAGIPKSLSSKDEIPRLPLYIEEMQEPTLGWLQNLVDDHRKHLGVDPIYISLSCSDSDRCIFDIADRIKAPGEADFCFRGRSKLRIPIKVRD